MIVVDTSALFAIALDEPDGPAIAELILADEAVMSTATAVELRVAAWRRGRRRLRDLMVEVVDRLGITTAPLDERMMAAALDAFDRYGIGRGEGPALLNFGDCFSYALAKSLSAPLLFVGDDFARTDIVPALRPGA